MLTLSNAKFVTEHAKYPTRYLNMFCNYLQTEVPSTTQTLKMADKEEHVQRAKLAEQAERYLLFSRVPDTPSSGLFLAFQFRILPFLTWIWIAKILP